MSFIEIKHTHTDRDEAFELANGFGKTTNPNYTKGNTREQGMLAELLFERHWHASRHESRRHDFRLGSRTINVKSNHWGLRTPPWLSWHVCVLTPDQPHHDLEGTDLVFAQLSFDPRETDIAYFVGFIQLREFNRISKRIRKGEPWLNGAPSITDCQVLQIKYLRPIEQLTIDCNIELCLPQ